MQPMTSKQRKAAALALATAIAVPAEGLRQFAYVCPAGVVTVCYGHTGADVRKNVKYSLDECKGLMSADMLHAVDQVERCAPGLPVKVLAAFADAVLNLGSTVACNVNASTAARQLRARNYAAACHQLPRWNKARVLGVMIELPGLTTRRAVERDLCLSGLS